MPPIPPVTLPTDPSNKPLASPLPNKTTEKTIPVVVPADPTTEFSVSTVVVLIVAGLVAVILLILAVGLVWMRMKRGRPDRTRRSSSTIDEDKKNEPLKTTVSNTTTSSIDADENAISLQHWTSKKAVSNRYESWHIGEIDHEWVH